jgi:MurNAc alpha-1-phosphate uridylyltransferase
LLGQDPFIVLSCDVISDYALQQLTTLSGLAHIVLVDNPDFNVRGDFNLDGNSVNCVPPCRLTYANIGLFHRDLFATCKPGKFRLGDVLKEHARQGLVTGEYFKGFWHNLGTPEQLQELNEVLA